MGTVNNFTNNFFVFLCESYDILATSHKYRSIGSWERALDYVQHKAMFEEIKAKQALRNLRKKKWIKDRKMGEEIEFKLTEKGEEELIKLKIQQEKKKLPFDQSCIVVFDFPVGANGARDKFRLFLKQSGFKRMQDSVWITQNDLAVSLQLLITGLAIEKWVRIIVGKEIGVE